MALDGQGSKSDPALVSREVVPTDTAVGALETKPTHEVQTCQTFTNDSPRSNP